MCRATMYLGKETLLSNLLYNSDNSLITQAHTPREMVSIQNLAGFGMCAWSKSFNVPQNPLIYKTCRLPFHERNLGGLSNSIKTRCALAHVRGVSYGLNEVISDQNAHPFLYKNTNLAFAHNGTIVDINKMKYDLMQYIKLDIFEQINGTTDSEWIYALFLSRFKKVDNQHSPTEISNAVLETLGIIRKIRLKNDIDVVSPTNLFITDGNCLIAIRFVFDYGHLYSKVSDAHFIYHSLWYTLGKEYKQDEKEYKMVGYPNQSSILIASEPLTIDTTTWNKVPEYSLLIAELKNKKIQTNLYDIQPSSSKLA